MSGSGYGIRMIERRTVRLFRLIEYKKGGKNDQQRRHAREDTGK